MNTTSGCSTAAARILISGHFHHFAAREMGDGKLWIQAPTLDNGSDWFFSGASDPRFDDDNLNQLKSIKNKLIGEQKYTEMFIKIGRESNVFRLEVPKEVYAAYLTDGEENEQILELYRKTGSMEKAIKEFTKKNQSI